MATIPRPLRELSSLALTSSSALDLDRLATVGSGLGHDLGGREGGLENGVDESRLAEAGLACKGSARATMCAVRSQKEAEHSDNAPTTMATNWKPRL